MLEELKNPEKTSKNSSTPLSSDKKANRFKTGSKSGAKQGHKGQHFQPISEADHEEKLPLCDCPLCQEDLSDHPVLDTHTHQVISIEIRRIVTNYLCEEKYCSGCQQNVISLLPEGVTRNHYDNSIRSLAAYLNNYHHLSHPRIIEFFDDLFDISLSKGTINSILTTSPSILKQFDERLKQLLRVSRLLGIDETGYRVAVKNFWLWVFQNPQFSCFYFSPRRSSQVLIDLIGKYFDGTVLSDFFSAYNPIKSRNKQKCNAHLLRELEYILECEKENRIYITGIVKLLIDAKEFKEAHQPYDPHQFDAETQTFKNRLDEFCRQDIDPKYTHSTRIQKRLIKHQKEILTFLEDPEIPFDNNSSERAIRSAVVHRKVIQCFQTTHGAHNYARWLSLIQTLKKQKIPIFKAIGDLFDGVFPDIKVMPNEA